MVERQRVTKRHEPHPADAQATAKPTEGVLPPAPAVADAPPPVKERPAAKRRVPAASASSPSESAAEDEGPKVPTSFRLPRSLLNRLDKGSRVIPAELDKNVSKNQIVEMAIDHYLAQFNI